MKLGGMSLPNTIWANGWEYFEAYYNQVCKGNVKETAEESYLLGGGVLPKTIEESVKESKKKADKQPTEE
jgi:hypothetical protein